MEQALNFDISDVVMREITAALLEGHGAGNGIAISKTCRFFDFETCQEINLPRAGVRTTSSYLRAAYLGKCYYFSIT